jgi:hypothetical protein
MSSPAIDHSPYRQLARAYPPGRRREELLDTMLMAAGDAARARPTGREVVDVLRHSPRAWLGRPGSRAVVPVAIIVALLVGFLAASLTGRLIGDGGRALPTDTEFAAIAEVVAPGIPAVHRDRRDGVHTTGGDEVEFGHVLHVTESTAQSRDVAGFAVGVTERLRADGWTIQAGDGADTADGHVVMATRDGQILRFDNDFNAASPELGGTLQIRVRTVEPSLLAAGSAMGGLVGLVIGWVFAGWVSRRTERSRAAGTALGVLAVVTSVLLQPIVLLVSSEYAALVRDGFTTGDTPFWGWTVPGQDLFAFAVLAAAAFVAAVGVALIRPKGSATASAQPARLAAIASVITALAGVGIAVTGALVPALPLMLLGFGGLSATALIRRSRAGLVASVTVGLSVIALILAGLSWTAVVVLGAGAATAAVLAVTGRTRLDTGD